MRKYAAAENYQSLEPWPFDNPQSSYKILRGNPQASGRFDIGNSNRLHSMGIWRCSEGAFECTEQGDEMQTIVSGRLILTSADGDSIECGPGDSIFTRKGERVTWDILEEVTKLFFSYNSDGVAD